MRLPVIFHISGKEILSTLRDRRAIISSIVMPLVLLPLMMIGLPLLMGGLFEREAETTTEIAIKGLENLPAELRTLLASSNLTLVANDDPFSAVQNDDFTIGLEVDDAFAEAISSNSATLILMSKSNQMRGSLNASKIHTVINAFNQERASQQLAAVDLDESILSSITIDNQDAATLAEKASGQLGWMIPFFLAIWTLTGGQMVAIDATAGEKERGTLEALLVSPVTRLEVVLGKFIAVLTFGLTAAVMGVLGYVLGGFISNTFLASKFSGEGSEIMAVMGGTVNLSISNIALLLGSTIILASMMSALLLSITMFARTLKEAQNYLAPLSFIMIIPALTLQFADFFNFSSLINLLPIGNMILLMNDLVQGQSKQLQITLTWTSTLIYTGLLLTFALASFKREGVIFRN